MKRKGAGFFKDTSSTLSKNKHRQAQQLVVQAYYQKN